MTKELFVVRHAEADVAETDFERPLTARGEVDAVAMGRRLSRLIGRAPDLLLASPARRARQTATLIAEELGYPVERVDLQAPIYEARPGNLFALLQDLEPALQRVVLVGHNPGVSDMCGLLIQQWVHDLPSGACMHLQLDLDHWGEIAPGVGKRVKLEIPARA